MPYKDKQKQKEYFYNYNHYEKECIECGTKVIGDKKRKYCKKCLSIFRSARLKNAKIWKKNIDKKGCFKKGEDSPNKGKKCSFNAKFGKDNPMWKGGITDPYSTLKKSFEWKEWRKSVFERDDYTCQECDINGSELHPHHIYERRNYPEIMFLEENGITLCKDCHQETFNKEEKYREKLLKNGMNSGNILKLRTILSQAEGTPSEGATTTGAVQPA